MSRSHERKTVTTKLYTTFPCVARSIETALSSVLDARIPRDAYLLDSLMSKYAMVSPENSVLRRDRAFASALTDEAINERTNKRVLQDQLFKRAGFRWDNVVSLTRELIADTLGDFDYGVYEQSKFTSGAAVGFRKDSSDPWFKFNARVTVTPNALRRTLALIYSTPLWRRTCEERYGPDPMGWVKLVRGNEGFTVPKNAEIDRFACKEPTGNMMLQTGIGTRIRNRLKRVGIDLNDQSRNRRLAKQASIDGRHATIDLKSASNSVTVSLCYLLLPEPWYAALISARSPDGKIGGKPHTWQMMSSMGNGFTFELESLLFWSLCEAVRRLSKAPGRTSVYGDDIITPVQCVHNVIAVLSFAGFRINKEKSFISGPIRESCGGHYYAGVDITPIYIRKPIVDTCRMIWFLNALRRWAGCDCEIADPRLEELYYRLRRTYIHRELWGGVRLSSISSLATPHRPWKRLKLLNADRRIDGVGAVLRTFMYAGPALTSSHKDFGPQDFYVVDDAQIYYEMFGSIRMSSDMSRIVTVSGSIAEEANSETFADRLAYFPRECANI